MSLPSSRADWRENFHMSEDAQKSRFRRTLPGSPAADRRDVMIVRARRLGYSLAQIAALAGMSKSGVADALKRIEAGRAGRA